jgi:hypothetical protein
MPPLLYDIMRVLLLLTGPAAFVCLLNAGIALRKEGGTVFWVGGGFSKWMLWAVIFLGLEPTLTWFQFFGAPVFFPPGAAIGTPWLASIQQDISTFVSSFVVGRIAPVCGSLVHRANRPGYSERGGTTPFDTESHVSSGQFKYTCADRRVDTGGRPLLDCARTRIDVELSGKPHHAHRRRALDLRSDRAVCLQPAGLSAPPPVRGWLLDGERFMDSDQPDDVSRRTVCCSMILIGL